jgi:hypothetical protein
LILPLRRPHGHCIADSGRTIKSHITSLLPKPHLRDRVQALLRVRQATGNQAEDIEFAAGKHLEHRRLSRSCRERFDQPARNPAASLRRTALAGQLAAFVGVAHVVIVTPGGGE